MKRRYRIANYSAIAVSVAWLATTDLGLVVVFLVACVLSWRLAKACFYTGKRQAAECLAAYSLAMMALCVDCAAECLIGSLASSVAVSSLVVALALLLVATYKMLVNGAFRELDEVAHLVAQQRRH
jgi:hypothetical protein